MIHVVVVVGRFFCFVFFPETFPEKLLEMLFPQTAPVEIPCYELDKELQGGLRFSGHEAAAAGERERGS